MKTVKASAKIYKMAERDRKELERWSKWESVAKILRDIKERQKQK